MNIFDRPTSKELLEAVLGFVNEEIDSDDYTKDNSCLLYTSDAADE